MLFLAALGVILHSTALSGWWLNDDPALLVEAVLQPATDVLFRPAEYTHLSAATFTPLLLLSFKADLLVRGMSPRLFYAHQVAAIIAAALLLFLLLRRYTPDLYATAGAGGFLASWVSVYAARTLMIRHYAEGLVFALGALLAWSYGRRGLIAGSLLYLAAMLSKEVYAPIPLFLICQERFAGRRWREIARDLVAPSLAAIVFLVWRWAMTGLTGTYQQSAVLPGFPSFSRGLWEGLVGPAPLWASIVWAICLVLALGLFLLRTRWQGVAFLAVAAIVIFLPILPLVARFEVRYSFAFATFVIAVITIAAAMSGRRWAIAIPAALLVTTVVMAFPQRRFYEDGTRHGMEQEGRYVWSQPHDAPALMATSPGWYLESLAWLRQHEHHGAPPRFVFSKYAITTGAIDPRRAVVITSGRAVALASTNLFGTPAEWERARQQFDPAAPLSIEFALRNHQAEWHLGPPGGRFVFLTDPGYSAIPIPPSGTQRVPAAREQQYFRIVRQVEDGRWTVSPRLAVPEEGGVTRWEKFKG